MNDDILKGEFCDVDRELQNLSRHQELFQRGLDCERLDKYRLALDYYVQAQAFYPQDSFVYERKAECLRQLNNLDAAETEILAALKLDPDEADNHFLYAFILSEKGENKKAQTEYEKALSIRPEDYETHINYGVLLNRMGKRKESIAHTKKAFEIQPNACLPWHNLAAYYFEEENSLEEKLQFKLRYSDLHQESYACVKEALRLDPNHARSLALLAKIHARRHEFKNAIAVAKKSLHLEPTNAFAKQVYEEIKDETTFTFEARPGVGGFLFSLLCHLFKTSYLVLASLASFYVKLVLYIFAVVYFVDHLWVLPVGAALLFLIYREKNKLPKGLHFISRYVECFITVMKAFYYVSRQGFFIVACFLAVILLFCICSAVRDLKSSVIKYSTHASSATSENDEAGELKKVFKVSPEFKKSLSNLQKANRL